MSKKLSTYRSLILVAVILLLSVGGYVTYLKVSIGILKNNQQEIDQQEKIDGKLSSEVPGKKNKLIFNDNLSEEQRKNILDNGKIHAENRWSASGKDPFGSIELVFIKQNDNGKYVPYPVYAIYGQTYTACAESGFEKGYSAKMKKYSRWKLHINEDCNGSTFLGPDTEYFIKGLDFSVKNVKPSQKRQDVYIPFKTPTKKEMREKKKRRLFIEINEDVFRQPPPEPVDRPKPQQLTFNVSGLKRSWFDQKNEVLSVQYRKHKKLWKWEGTQEYSGKVQDPMDLQLQFDHNYQNDKMNLGNVTGGSVTVLHGKNTWRETRLLYHRENVEQKQINIDGNSRYSWWKKEWISEQFDLAELARSHAIEPEKIGGVALYFPDPNKGEFGNRFPYGVPVMVRGFTKEDKPATFQNLKLSAPEGKYSIGVYLDEFHALQENFQWPPEN